MEIEFYNGAFLPFDREDRIVLAEAVDSVADIIQETAFGICLSRVELPKTYIDDFKDLIESIYTTVSTLKEMYRTIGCTYLGQSLSKAHEVEKFEDNVDRIERRILKNCTSAIKMVKLIF